MAAYKVYLISFTRHWVVLDCVLTRLSYTTEQVYQILLLVFRYFSKWIATIHPSHKNLIQQRRLSVRPEKIINNCCLMASNSNLIQFSATILLLFNIENLITCFLGLNELTLQQPHLRDYSRYVLSWWETSSLIAWAHTQNDARTLPCSIPAAAFVRTRLLCAGLSWWWTRHQRWCRKYCHSHRDWTARSGLRYTWKAAQHKTPCDNTYISGM